MTFTVSEFALGFASGDLAAAGLALREACREHDEVARHGDCPVCAALDAFDAALAAALGPRQEQTDEHD